MKILAFSDLHRDLGRAASLVERSGGVDVVVGAGDFASVHEGLEETIGALEAIETPTVLVPGNNETVDALREAAAGWDAATVLHGESAEIDGVTFFGLGAGIPVTPWDWSFDLSDDEAAAALAACPDGAVLVLHSPPKGHCDVSGAGESLGSQALADAIERVAPPLAVCGHIHESWGERSRIGDTEIANLGPDGATFEALMGFIGFIILGLFAGTIARALMPGRTEPGGCIGTTAIGVLGALLGGWLATELDLGKIKDFFDLETWLIAIAGSFLLLMIVRIFSR